MKFKYKCHNINYIDIYIDSECNILGNNFGSLF